ncbi:MAG: HEAT repeat domain-containing protein [Bradymonadaceae bacterium]|nr:HEAT repeat domain-containing protein [Lujinxingiaceae bacterium]
MIKSKTKWCAALGSVVCVGGVVAWLNVDGANPAAPKTELVEVVAPQHSVKNPDTHEVTLPIERLAEKGCAFRAQEGLAYDLVVEGRGALDLSGIVANVAPTSTGDVRTSTRARLELRALSSDEHASLLVGRFARIEANHVVDSARLGEPFLVSINPDCSIVGFAHAKDIDQAYARVQQALVHELSWMWPTEGKASFEGRAHLGTYLADVTTAMRLENQVSQKLWVEQNIVDFKPWPAGPATMQRVTSHLQRVRPGTVSWFEELDNRTSYVGARSSLQQGTKAKYLSANTPSLDGVSTAETDYVWTDLLPLDLHLAEPQPPTRAEVAALDAVRHLTIEQAVEQYVERVASEVAIQDTWPALRDFLEVKPQAAGKIVTMMQRREVKPEATMGIYIALGNARTPEARSALEGIMNDEGAPVIERSRAILSLIDRDDVGLDLANSLGQRASALVDGEDSASRMLARQSLLALGAMSGRKPQDAEIKASALRAATQLLAQTKDKDALYQRPVFGALANVGDPKSLALIAHIPNHPDPAVREAAAIVFRRMPPAASADFTAQWLAKETNASVKRALWHTIELQTFDAQAMTSDQVLKYAVRDLKEKPGFITRKALIRLLARAIEQTENDELGIADLFAHLMPFEFEQKSGYHRMMDPHIDDERLAAIYDEVARSFVPDENASGADERSDDPDQAPFFVDPVVDHTTKPSVPGGIAP